MYPEIKLMRFFLFGKPYNLRPLILGIHQGTAKKKKFIPEYCSWNCLTCSRRSARGAGGGGGGCSLFFSRSLPSRHTPLSERLEKARNYFMTCQFVRFWHGVLILFCRVFGVACCLSFRLETLTVQWRSQSSISFKGRCGTLLYTCISTL